MSCGRVRRHGRAADGAGFARERSACVADDPECARESPVWRASRAGLRSAEQEIAPLDLIG